MNKIVLVSAAGLLLIIAIICCSVMGRNRIKDAPKTANTAAFQTLPLTNPKVDHPPLLTATEWQQYHSAREGALAADPSLQNQYRELLGEMDTLQNKTDELLVKVDPNLKPIMAKLEALRLRNGGVAAANAEGKPAPKLTGNAPIITPAEWQEIRAARAEAVAQYPNVVSSSKKLQEQMIAFEKKLDMEMTKVDPSSALVISKFDSGRPVSVGK